MIEFSTDTNGQDFNKFSLMLGQTKVASLVEVPVDLNDRAFANPHSRELPTHTKEATLQSSIYFYGNKLNGNTWDSAYPEEMVESRLEKAAKFWNAVSEFEAIKNYQPPVEKSASTVYEYAIEESNLLPIQDEESLQKSASVLVSEEGRALPYVTRAKAASLMLIKDNELNVLDPETTAKLEKSVGLYPKEASEAKEKVTLLAHNLDEPLKGSLLKIASTMVDDSLYVDLAVAIDEVVEKKAFVVEDLFYDEHVVEPTIKLANDVEVKWSDIKAAGTDIFSILGESTPYKVSDGKGLDQKKAETFLSNMSRSDADLYYKALNSFLS